MTVEDLNGEEDPLDAGDCPARSAVDIIKLSKTDVGDGMGNIGGQAGVWIGCNK